MGLELDGRDLQTGNFCELDIITFSKQFQVLRTLHNPSQGSGWDRHDQQANLNELDDVSNFNHSIWF